MSKLLAKWILPHFHNDNRPYALRHQYLFLFVMILALSQVVTNSLTGTPSILSFATNIKNTDIIQLTNKERSKQGLKPLKEDLRLSQAAFQKAEDMFEKDYWAHFAPDGTSPWYFFQEAGYQYTWAGENLARDFQTSSGVVSGWMASTAGHRENILNNNFLEIGVGVKDGILQGEETTLVVQLFGNPVSYTASTSGGNLVSGKEVTVEDKIPIQKRESGESVISQGEISTTGGVSGEKSTTLSLADTIENLSTSQKTSFGLLFVLGSLFAVDSFTIFRKRHDRTNSHSGVHASVILILMVTLLAQSVGSIL